MTWWLLGFSTSQIVTADIASLVSGIRSKKTCSMVLYRFCKSAVIVIRCWEDDLKSSVRPRNLVCFCVVCVSITRITHEKWCFKTWVLVGKVYYWRSISICNHVVIRAPFWGVIQLGFVGLARDIVDWPVKVKPSAHIVIPSGRFRVSISKPKFWLKECSLEFAISDTLIWTC